ncbi:hypothetical protein KCU78_g54, partial [Aureobasidium melanogenum]
MPLGQRPSSVWPSRPSGQADSKPLDQLVNIPTIDSGTRSKCNTSTLPRAQEPRIESRKLSQMLQPKAAIENDSPSPTSRLLLDRTPARRSLQRRIHFSWNHEEEQEKLGSPDPLQTIRVDLQVLLVLSSAELVGICILGLPAEAASATAPSFSLIDLFSFLFLSCLQSAVVFVSETEFHSS